MQLIYQDFFPLLYEYKELTMEKKFTVSNDAIFQTSVTFGFLFFVVSCFACFSIGDNLGYNRGSMEWLEEYQLMQMKGEIKCQKESIQKKEKAQN